jgi:hypothetical protein
MGERIDRSRNAAVYDCRHGAAVPANLARRLALAAGVGISGGMLDVGAGTGRVTTDGSEASSRS